MKLLKLLKRVNREKLLQLFEIGMPALVPMALGGVILTGSLLFGFLLAFFVTSLAVLCIAPPIPDRSLAERKMLALAEAKLDASLGEINKQIDELEFS